MAIEIRLKFSGYNLEINAKTRALYYAQGMTIYQLFRRYFMVFSSPALVLPSNLNELRHMYTYIGHALPTITVILLSPCR